VEVPIAPRGEEPPNPGYRDGTEAERRTSPAVEAFHLQEA